MTGPTFAPAAPSVARAAPAKPTPPARAALARPDAQSGGVRVLTYLRLHWLTILFLGALIGAGLAYAAWVLVPPKYESYALFQVASAPANISADPNRGRTEFNTYLTTAASQFKRELVYTGALRMLRDNATLAAQKDPMKFLDQELMVETKDGLEIITLRMRGGNPSDVRAIVHAMSKSYMEQVVEKEQTAKRSQLEALEKHVSGIATKIKQKTGPNGVGGLPGSLPDGGPPLAIGTPGGTTAAPDHVRRAMFPELIKQAVKVRDQLPEYDAQAERLRVGIEATKTAMQKLLDDPVSTDATDAAKMDEAYLKAKFAADQHEAEYRDRSARVNDPTSPTMVALKFRADAAREEADAILTTKAKALEGDRRKLLFAKMSQEVTLAQANLTDLAKRKARAVGELEQLDEELNASLPPPVTPSQVAAKGPLADPASTEIHTYDKMYEKLTSLAIALEIELSQKRVTAQSYAPPDQEPQYASTPQVVDAKKQILATVFAGLMGFAVVAAGVLLVETRARKVSSLGELKGTTQTPVVGVVPWLPDGATARDPLKRADVNEAIDKLRAYVVQSWLSRGASTVTVTSALGDEGKAFTAFGLASSLAQAGYKALLVDFDLRNPGLHSFAGVPNAVGVCELLRGEADFRKTIQILPNGLHFLAAGKWSDDARQAAVGGRLEALLNRLKEPFDCVVLHGHALLTVAESVEVARRSEVVLLCALYRDTRGPMLKRATDRVATMEIPFTGIVYLGATPNEALC